nr:leucine-rich repeat serine/threonine-protein kinase 2 isoform X2 [Hydra vulgaris]
MKKNDVKDEEALKSTINIKSGSLGYTTLHDAVESKKPNDVKRLLDLGADVNLMADGGYTPLHLAAYIDACSCIEVLLDYNADTKLCNQDKQTPYEIAVCNNCVNSAQLLLSHDILTCLKQKRNYEFFKYLKTVGCKSVTPDCFDKCLKLAVEEDNFAVIGIILLRKPHNAKECLIDALKNELYSKSTLILLLCYAVEKHFNDVIKVIFENKDLESNKNQLVKCDIQISAKSLHHLKSFVSNDKVFAYLVSIGCNHMVKNYKGVEYILLNMFCDNKNLKAYWKGLLLRFLHKDWFKSLIGFKYVILSCNQIKNIPTGVLSYLEAVEILNLSLNNLQEVPSELFRLPKLYSLNLSSNQLRHLPDVKEWSPFLTTLFLTKNLLETFPLHVEELKLKHLFLSNNRLKCFPESICNLICLETLDISQNVDINTLPQSIGNLSKLTQLDLIGLEIKNLPPQYKTTKDILNYLKGKLRHSKPYYKMKLMIIGFPRQGKTTLLKRLKDDTNYNMDQATHGIDIEEITIKKSLSRKEFIFRVWDFAGQEEYFATHQCFLSSSSLYILVWDVSKKNEYAQLLQPWFENLVARVKFFYIIVVGTKLDLLESDNIDNACNQMKTEIETLIETIPAIRNLKYSDKYFSSRLKICFVSLNTKFPSYSKDIEKLKAEIYDLAGNMTYDGEKNGEKIMGKMFPQSYTKLEEKINEIKNQKVKNCGIPIISQEEFISMGKSLKCDNDVFQDDDFEPATKFLMNTGTILYFDGANKGLRDCVFINPSWVCKLMSNFITVDAVHTFVKNGILEQDKIPLILKEELGHQNPDLIKICISLLSRFQIACKIDDHRVLIPPKLPSYDPKHALINQSSLLTRYYFFSCIPDGFWARFITRFLSMTKEMLSPKPINETKPKFSLIGNNLPKDELDAVMSYFENEKPPKINETNSSNILYVITSPKTNFTLNQIHLSQQLSRNIEPSINNPSVFNNVDNLVCCLPIKSFPNNSETSNESKISNSSNLSSNTVSPESIFNPDAKALYKNSSSCNNSINKEINSDCNKKVPNNSHDECLTLISSTDVVVVKNEFNSELPGNDENDNNQRNNDSENYQTDCMIGKYDLDQFYNKDNSVSNNHRDVDNGVNNFNNSTTNSVHSDFYNRINNNFLNYFDNGSSYDLNNDINNCVNNCINYDINADHKDFNNGIYNDVINNDIYNDVINNDIYNDVINNDIYNDVINNDICNDVINNNDIYNDFNNGINNNINSVYNDLNNDIKSSINGINYNINNDVYNINSDINNDNNIDINNSQNSCAFNGLNSGIKKGINYNFDNGNNDVNAMIKSLPTGNNENCFTHVSEYNNFVQHHSYYINVLKELQGCVIQTFEANSNERISSDSIVNKGLNSVVPENEIPENKTKTICLTDSKSDYIIDQNMTNNYEISFEQYCEKCCDPLTIVNELIKDNSSNFSDCNCSDGNCSDDEISNQTNYNINSDSKLVSISLDAHVNAHVDDIVSKNDDFENTVIDDYMQIITETDNFVNFNASMQTVSNLDYKDYTSANEEIKEENDEIESQLINELSINDEDYEEHFNDYGELAYLLDKGYLSCWNHGVIFNHPQLSFSVQQLPILYKADRKTIEICVTKSSLGYRVLSYVVDHIRTLLDEWFEGLLMSHKEPHVVSSLACPVCVSLGINPPHLFNITNAFQKLYQNSEDNTCAVFCKQKHVPRTINITEFCPDLTFQDLPKTMKFNPNDIQCEQNEKCKLGQGAFGKVYSGLCKNKIRAAIKFYNFNMNNSDELSSSLNQFYEIRREIVMLSKLRHHPYIVQFLGFLLKPELCAVMECASHGALSSVIYDKSKTKVIPRIVKFRICQQIASALAFMHKKCIIHRDIKSDNILLFSLNHEAKINIKLTDFGTANIMSPSGLKTFFGTKVYAAPEMISHRLFWDEYTSSVDIYSFGMVIYELIAFKKPFYHVKELEIDNEVKNGYRPKFYNVADAFYGLSNLTKLMITMWNQEPSKRPHANDILNTLSPTFQLVFGYKMLASAENPRNMCYVNSSKELWITCDDKEEQSIIVINMESFKTVKKIEINATLFGLESFNMSSITTIGDKNVCVVLKSVNDVILVYTAENYSVIHYYKINNIYVCSISANKDSVCLGFDDGRCSKVSLKSFLNGKMLKKSYLFGSSEKKKISVTTSVLLSETFIWSSGDSFKYCNLKKYEDCKKVKCDTEQEVKEISFSLDEKLFFVYYQCSPEIDIYNVETKKLLHSFSCQDDIFMFLPKASDNDIRVTCVCSVDDMLWVGTGSGHILIYELHNIEHIYKTKLLQTLHPYEIEVRKLLLVVMTQPRHDGVKYVIVSIGSKLNSSAFGINSFFEFNGYIPKDQTAIDQKLYTHLDNDGNDDDNDRKAGKVVIVWHVLQSHQYKNLIFSSY